MTLPELLRELHRLHLKIRDLRNEGEQGPRKLKSYQAKIERFQKELAAEQDAIKHLKTSIHAKEVEIKDNEQKTAKYQTQMGSATTKKEYDAFRHEIDHVKQANRVIEDDILEVMMQLDERTKKLPEFEKAIQQAKEEHRKAEADLGGRLKEHDHWLADAETALKAVEAQLTGDPRQAYDRLLVQYGAEALAPLENRSCSGCYTELTSQQQNDLRAGRMVTCKSCARLLYLPE
jgi:predicted  nucleic acid-binding Zn-ribbon protein